MDAARRLGVLPEHELDDVLDLTRLAGLENEPRKKKGQETAKVKAKG
jgi:hypothetical protein